MKQGSPWRRPRVWVTVIVTTALVFALSALWHAAVGRVLPGDVVKVQDVSVVAVRPPLDGPPPCGRVRCTAHETAVYLAWRYRHNRIHHSTWYRHRLAISPRVQRKMMAAYVRYTRTHSPAIQGSSARRANGLRAGPLSAQAAVGLHWPSPRRWMSAFASTVGCAFVGSTPGAKSMFCGTHGGDMGKMIVPVARSTDHFIIRCGADFVLGGLGGLGIKHLETELSIRFAGGYGVLVGAATCAWNDYLRRYFW